MDVMSAHRKARSRVKSHQAIYRQDGDGSEDAEGDTMFGINRRHALIGFVGLLAGYWYFQGGFNRPPWGA